MDIPEDSMLQAVARRLAEILRIQDWDITVKAVTGYELNKKTGEECTSCGVSDRYIRLNQADIYLNKEANDDWYEVLVHEMLHIQSVSLEHCAEAYFDGRHSYFTDIYENLTDKQAQIFVKIYPLARLEKEGVINGKESN